jgi:hypothetical protein
MTFLELTFDLQSSLSLEQLKKLGEFANTYGLRRFRLDDLHKQLTFEYDASRLRQAQVMHALGELGIAAVPHGSVPLQADY